jgi:hypothetical protein
MRTAMTLSVPGTSSAGRLRRAVPRHPRHFAVPPERQPALQPGLVLRQFGARDADRAEAELPGPTADVARERVEVRLRRRALRGYSVRSSAGGSWPAV